MTSLVLGIVSFVLWPAGIITAPLAIIFGNKARRDAAEHPEAAGSGMGTAGKVLGFTWLGLAVFGILLIVLFIVPFGAKTSSTFSCTATNFTTGAVGTC